jgi:hypothetical protein
MAAVISQLFPLAAHGLGVQDDGVVAHLSLDHRQGRPVYPIP